MKDAHCWFRHHRVWTTAIHYTRPDVYVHAIRLNMLARVHTCITHWGVWWMSGWRPSQVFGMQRLSEIGQLITCPGVTLIIGWVKASWVPDRTLHHGVSISDHTLQAYGETTFNQARVSMRWLNKQSTIKKHQINLIGGNTNHGYFGLCSIVIPSQSRIASVWKF